MIPKTRRTKLLTAAVAALVAATAVTWATGTGPFGSSPETSHCWGSWQEGEGSDSVRLREDKGGTPSPGHPQGTCTATVATSKGDVTVTVSYGPAPASPSERTGWIFSHLGPGRVPLPDGLSGAAGADTGLLVLPAKCDTSDGRPTAVALETDATSTTDLGGIGEVAEIITAAANHGMEKAGCAPAKPLRITSPVLSLPEETESYFAGRACRIPGLDFPQTRATRLEYQVGAVSRDLQSCAVRDSHDSHTEILDLLMVAEPRISALFGDTAGTTRLPGWRGTGTFTDDYAVLRADCAGRATTFLTLDPGAVPPARTFAVFANAVAQRLGCAAITTLPPAGATS
ncbi:hypothetical protein [Streptomyces sp. NPDC050738]|uniref:hypothetical protein n=1 Tax=Streptomyces sp. NPDC050738 TaxID=3154744 RepID=UPI003447BF1C